MTHSKNRTKPAGGFTLIEVVLGLTLLVIILGAVYSSFFAVRRAIDRFEDASLRYHEARTALDLMRREVEGSLLKYYGRSNPGEEPGQTAFVIEDSDIFGKPASRLTLTFFSFKGGGLNSASYYVQEENGKLTLVKKENPAYESLSGMPRREISQDKVYVSEVVEDIEGFAVETLYKGKWIRTWDTKQTAGLPDTVRFSIEFYDGDKKVRLMEYARPKMGRQL